MGLVVGKKYVMAITGLIGIGFVVVHMIGNLKVYLGMVEHDGEQVYDIDVYGEFLRELLVPLLPRTVRPLGLRIVLIVALVLHLHAAYSLTIINRRARPVQYQSKRDYVAANFASRTMRWTGIIVLLFLIFHLADLTWGWFNPDFVRGEVYRNLDASLPGSRWRSSTSSPTSPSASTCSTARGACSSRWAGTTRGSTRGAGPRHGDRHDHRRRQRLVPDRRPGRHHPDLRTADDRHPRTPIAPRESADARRQDPAGPLAEKWDTFIADSKLVNPNNKRKFKVIVVGTGLAGASAAATLAELGYQVEAFTFHDSPRRAHSIAAQGGINAAKNYRGDGDSIHRLFYDTIKGGDFRRREGNVYRLAQVSGNIIDQMVAQGVPFAREYGGLLDNRSFGGAQVSRTFYARRPDRPAAAPRRLPADGPPGRLGNVKLWNRMELVDIVVVDGRCAGIVTRDLLTGEISSHNAHAVILATGGYGNAFFLSTNAMACNVTAAWRAHRSGAYFANPCYTQIHPTCIPQSDEFQSKLTLMSESLRNDGRVWVPKQAGDDRPAGPDPRGRARLLPRAAVPELRQPRAAGHLVPGRQAGASTPGAAWARSRTACTSTSPTRSAASASTSSSERYGNLFEMYERITGENPYEVPMRIYPASHYTMGGLWVDYELMTTIPGLYCAGEANFSDHGANRLGASALMQGLADGYFVLPYTIGNYLARCSTSRSPTPTIRSSPRPSRPPRPASGYLSIGGTRSPDYFHRELGKIIWDYCGMDRNAEGLEKALREIPALYEEFQKDLRVTGRR